MSRMGLLDLSDLGFAAGQVTLVMPHLLAWPLTPLSPPMRGEGGACQIHVPSTVTASVLLDRPLSPQAGRGLG